MRFMLYDRVSHIERGVSICGSKSFSLSDDFLKNHFHRQPVVPATMLVEAMAQLVGWAVIHAWDFKLSAILCLVDGLEVTDPLIRPGFNATIKGEIVTSHRDDSLGRASIEVDGEVLATIDRLIFRHFRPVDEDQLRCLFTYCSGRKQVAHRAGPETGNNEEEQT